MRAGVARMPMGEPIETVDDEVDSEFARLTPLRPVGVWAAPTVVVVVACGWLALLWALHGSAGWRAWAQLPVALALIAFAVAWAVLARRAHLALSAEATTVYQRFLLVGWSILSFAGLVVGLVSGSSALVWVALFTAIVPLAPLLYRPVGPIGEAKRATARRLAPLVVVEAVLALAALPTFLVLAMTIDFPESYSKAAGLATVYGILVLVVLVIARVRCRRGTDGPTTHS